MNYPHYACYNIGNFDGSNSFLVPIRQQDCRYNGLIYRQTQFRLTSGYAHHTQNGKYCRFR
ncbi:hypothetical protein [Wielerella bovis]|uniref:hypothetical protein n=1 Tax=Wielerella bovis TaxID=2917790 RepID=UPI002019B7EB|nr:hypothetical protein [Wielerella bovis]ULJ59378.1 hypothetical protein MIS44_06610 [Wielerella bovis]ULJ60048.1 hypothetical protein MIS44_10360 [Wielerella bovis]